MAEVCSWDEVFKKYTKKENESLVVLYWYLFNKPNYQKKIAEEMRELRELDEYKEKISSYLAYENNIGNCIQKMEEHNLIGIIKSENRKKFYQALSFFYLDPFCVKTPELKASTVDEHYEKYRNRIKELGIATYHKDPIWIYSFEALKNNAVIPEQGIVQNYSLEPEKFLKFYFQKKRYYLTLYELIRESFSNVDSFLYYFGKERKQKIENSENHGIEYLSIEKILDDDTPPKYHDITPVMDLTLNIMQIYTNLELGRVSFNKEKLEFEGEIL